jgi:hypothetical protein
MLTLALWQVGPHLAPFGRRVAYFGVTACCRTPAVVVIVNCAWAGVKSGKTTTLLHPVVPGQLTVIGLESATLACTVSAPGGALMISAVRPPWQPTKVHTVLYSQPRTTTAAIAIRKDRTALTSV